MQFYLPNRVHLRYDKVVHDKEILISKHITYGEESKKDLKSTEMTDWFAENLDDINDILDEVFLILDAEETRIKMNNAQLEDAARTHAEDTRKKAELVILDKQCKMEEKEISDRIEAMQLIVDDAEKTSKEDGILVQTQLEGVELLLESLIKSWNTYKTQLEEKKDPALNAFLQREDELRHKLADSRVAVKGFIKSTLPPTSIDEDDTRSNTSSSSTAHSSFPTKTVIEKMSVPTFGGNCRAFARFKGDFNNIVVPNYTDEVHRLYVLKEKCLKGPAKVLVENLQTIDEIWERLESKFGNSSEVLNLVINDVKSMRIERKDEERGLVMLVDTLEKGLQDLTAIKARSEIANTYTVNLIEEKLPTEIVKRWYLQESDEKEASTGNTGETRFESLLQFLKKERKNAEKIIQLKIKDESYKKDEDKSNKKDRKYSNVIKDSKKDKSNKHNNTCLLHPTGNHLTRKCREFQAKTVAERGKIVKDLNGCKLCLSVSHIGNPCPFENTWQPCNTNGCTGKHSRLIHGCGIPEFSCHIRYNITQPTGASEAEELSCSAAQRPAANSTLMLVQSTRTASGEATVFWDDGSTLCLVSSKYVRREGLTGVKVTYDLITAGNVNTTHETMMFEIALLDRKGNKHLISAYEISDICGHMDEVDTEPFTKLFPSLKHEDIARKAGEIDLLIGSNYLSLHPTRIDCSEGIVLYKSLFGTGRIVAGSLSFDVSNVQLSATVRHHSHAQVGNVRILKSMSLEYRLLHLR